MTITGACLLLLSCNAGCADHRVTARARDTHTLSRIEAVRQIDEACRTFIAGVADQGDIPTDDARAGDFASQRLRLVRAAQRALRAIDVPPELAHLRQHSARQLDQVEALYSRASTETAPTPLLKQAQATLVEAAGDLVAAGATGCAPLPSRKPAAEVPAGAGTLLDRRPVATVVVGPLGADDNRIVADDRMVWVGLKNLNEMVRIDPASNSVVARVPLGASPGGLPQIVGGFVWIPTSNSMIRIDPRTNSIDRRVPRTDLGVGDGHIIALGDTLVACHDPWLITADAATGKAVGSAQIPTGCVNAVVSGDDIWVLDDAADLRRIDRATGSTLAGPVHAFDGFQTIQATSTSVWAFGPADVEQLDARSGRIVGTARRPGIDFIEPCADDHALWVASEPEQRIIRVDAATHAVVELAAGQGANAIACSSGTLWVANSDESTVSRFDVGDL